MDPNKWINPNRWIHDPNEYSKDLLTYLMIEEAFLDMIILCIMSFLHMCVVAQEEYNKRSIRRRIIPKLRRDNMRREFMDRLVNDDIACVEQLRMNAHTFRVLCHMLQMQGRLKEDGLVPIQEQVAMFLHILAHHSKNRVIKFKFQRSGETISRYFNLVLNSVLRLQKFLLKKPTPITEGCDDDKWKYFKGCLGALDGTFIKVHVHEVDKPRYRNRKGEIATNVLGVCSKDMKFIYVLPGWEGSASDARILRDAITRRNGLKVPIGLYYLVDAGYANAEGFLAPYRGTRYHLNEWKRGCTPTTPQELFNMRHSAARNVIERAFGLLKIRWAILRSPSFYPIKTQNRIIIACCLLHNLIRTEMPVDPSEMELDNTENSDEDYEPEVIQSIEPNDAWRTWRDEYATNNFQIWAHHT